MKSHTVVVVSDDASTCDSIRDLLESAGLQVETFSSLRAYLPVASPRPGNCLVVDHGGDVTISESQSEFAECCALMAVILITERGNVAASVRAIKAGAKYIVEKPYREKSLLGRIKKALEASAHTNS